MKKIIQLVLLTFIYFAISFVEYSHAYKENPTQPIILDLSNSTPTPNYSNCSLSFNACGAQNYSSFTDPIYLIDYCGDPSIYEIFSLTAGDPLNCAESEFPRAIDCKQCDCPVGQFRSQGMCVPEAAYECDFGIANYLTGECYPQSCPYGDGSPEDCRQTPYCPESELTTVIEANPARCECTGGLIWNANQEKCVEPPCDGINNSPIDSIFDPDQQACACPSTHTLFTDTNTCVRFECENPDEVFVSSRAQCEVATACAVDQTLITATNTCQTFLNFNCGSVTGHRFPFWGEEAMANDLAIEIAACNACVSSGGLPDIRFEINTVGTPTTRFYYCSAQESLCTSRAGEWNSDIPACLNANIPDIPSSSSSSFNSNSASSQSQSSFSSSSASSINSGGGSGSSSGTNTSSGSGNGNGDGSGGNGTSAGSAASSGNNSSQGAGQCDPEAKDYLECIAPDQSDLPNHTGTNSGFTSIDQVNQAFVNRVSNSPVVQGFRNFDNIISVQNAECPALSIDLSDVPPINVELNTDIHCQIFEDIRPIISVVMLAVFAFLGFRIFASA